MLVIMYAPLPFNNAFNNTTLTALLETIWYAVMLPKFCCFVAINIIRTLLKVFP